MKFNLHEAMEILSRTPNILEAQLSNMPMSWTHQNEGPETWSPFDVVGHLIHGELTDWIPRAEIILSNASDKSFVPYDRFAQFENSKGKTMDQLLSTFKKLRFDNLEKLGKMKITADSLSQEGIHPEFGEVSLSQLLSAWVVHDLGHLVQIHRVMAKIYKEEAGPWPKYLKVLN